MRFKIDVYNMVPTVDYLNYMPGIIAHVKLWGQSLQSRFNILRVHVQKPNKKLHVDAL